MTRWTCCDPNGVTFCIGCADDIKAGRTLPRIAKVRRTDAYRKDYCHHCQTAPIESDGLCRFCITTPPWTGGLRMSGDVGPQILTLESEVAT